jgi:hypothetical protein
VCVCVCERVYIYVYIYIYIYYISHIFFLVIKHFSLSFLKLCCPFLICMIVHLPGAFRASVNSL